jgi:hypothetical protein
MITTGSSGYNLRTCSLPQKKLGYQIKGLLPVLACQQFMMGIF